MVSCRFRGREPRHCSSGQPETICSWLWSVVLAVLSSGVSQGQETASFFRQNCASCHTIGGGRLRGPDLKEVTARKDREWLITFILNPKAVIDSGDAYARQLQDESKGEVMPTTYGLTRDRVTALLDLIDEESKKERSQFAGMQISDRPFTPADVESGRRLFMGYARFSRGGPACLACHRAGGVGPLGGGRLGTDLTRIYGQHGRKGLAAWLSAPPTPPMQPIYKDTNHPLTPEEIVPLVAYLEHTAQHGREDSGVAPVNFFLLGLAGAVVGLVLFDAIWRWRFRSVRRSLVHGEENRGTS